MVRKYKNVRYWYTVIPMLVVLILLLSFVAIFQDSRGRWITQDFRVQFSSLRSSSLVPYNGCYLIDKERELTTRNRLFNKRAYYDSYEANELPAKFGYCEVRSGCTVDTHTHTHTRTYICIWPALAFLMLSFRLLIYFTRTIGNGLCMEVTAAMLARYRTKTN